MMDILDRLRLKIQRIPAGSYHTCGDACTNTDCLLVGARQKIEELRGLLDQIETIAVNDKSGCLRCTEIVNLIHWALRPDSATQSDQPSSSTTVCYQCGSLIQQNDDANVCARCGGRNIRTDQPTGGEK